MKKSYRETLKMPDFTTLPVLKTLLFRKIFYAKSNRYASIKDAVKSILRIGSAHNKGGPADINIAQISHLSNFLT